MGRGTRQGGPQIDDPPPQGGGKRRTREPPSRVLVVFVKLRLIGAVLTYGQNRPNYD
jgi:hypothetical protein